MRNRIVAAEKGQCTKRQPKEEMRVPCGSNLSAAVSEDGNGGLNARVVGIVLVCFRYCVGEFVGVRVTKDIVILPAQHLQFTC